MIVLRRLFSSKTKDEEKKKSGLVRTAEVIGGAGLIGTGVEAIDSSYRAGDITGRKRLYHGTSKEAKKSILNEGLKGSKALDPDNLTNTMMGNLGKEDGRELVYTGKRRLSAMLMAINQRTMAGKDPAMVNISIPVDEYDKLKKVYDNPEFTKRLGVNSKEEFVKVAEKSGTGKAVAKRYYDLFSGNKGTSGTRIIEGDIDSRYIKGSKDYQKNSLKEVLRYARKHPKRFLKGIGKTGIGISSVGGGLALASGKVIKSDKNKKESRT